jgi:hypothetical protein
MPLDSAAFGDGLLLDQGYTLVWLGWQHDVPERQGRMRLYAPVAVGVAGMVRSEFTPDAPVKQFSLGDSGHVPYAVADPSLLTITVRDAIHGQRKPLPSREWSINNGTEVHLTRPALPGHIYEVIYRAKNPVIAGVGLAGIRDLISFLKFGSGSVTVLGDQRQSIKRAIGFGTSQSAMVLRTLLYEGFNQDENGRKVFDGIFANVAGARRSTFQRFAQPSRTAGPMRNASFSTTDQFPFADLELKDPVIGVTDGVLAKSLKANVVPRIFYTNSSCEYWGSDGSLIHTTPDGKDDAPLPASTRLYLFTSGQHGPAAFPPQQGRGQNPPNFNDYRWVMRALLGKLNAWITEGAEPPASLYPRIADRTLVPVAAYAFPRIPLTGRPDHAHYPLRLDFGPEYRMNGLVSKEPPAIAGPAYGVLVPQCDRDGNDLAGIRTPEIVVPIGTFLGWNLRSPSAGAPTELLGNTGSFIPFAPTRAERERTGDPRLSIEERYESADSYLSAVRTAASDLSRKGFLLPGDSDAIVQTARRYWQWAIQGSSVTAKSDAR